MKKLVCLLAVLALAGAASAQIDVVVGGVFQGNWGSGSLDSWGGGVFAENGAGAIEVDSGQGWNMIRADAYTNIGNNTTFEYDIYYDSDATATYSECMNMYIGGDKQWQEQLAVTIDDGAVTVTDAKYNNEYPIYSPGDKWLHITVDLNNNGLGAMGADLDLSGLNVSEIRIGGHNHTGGTYNTDSHMLISNMAFTPEPATIALLGLGGLALIRRKR